MTLGKYHMFLIIHTKGVFCALHKFLHKGYICTRTRAVLSLSLHKSIFLKFLHHGTKMYDKYIKSENRNKYIDDDGTGIFPKQTVGQIYNENYLKTCFN